MDIVIDTSALLAVIVDEPEREEIVNRTAGHTLIAPASVPWEVGNAFSAMFKKGRVSLEEAQEGVSIFERIPVRYTIPALAASLEIAHEYDLYSYDAYLLECALRRGAPLLTLDRRLVKAGKRLGVSCLEV